MGKYWLAKKAELVARGAIASGDTEAMKELMDFLDSFVLRQGDKMGLFWGKYWKTKTKAKRIRDIRADKGCRIRETKQGWGIYFNSGLSMNRASLWRD